MLFFVEIGKRPLFVEETLLPGMRSCSSNKEKSIFSSGYPLRTSCEHFHKTEICFTSLFGNSLLCRHLDHGLFRHISEVVFSDFIYFSYWDFYYMKYKWAIERLRNLWKWSICIFNEPNLVISVDSNFSKTCRVLIKQFAVLFNNDHRFIDLIKQQIRGSTNKLNQRPKIVWSITTDGVTCTFGYYKEALLLNQEIIKYVSLTEYKCLEMASRLRPGDTQALRATRG